MMESVILKAGEVFVVKTGSAVEAVNKVNRALKNAEINNIATLVDSSTVEMASLIKSEQEKKVIEKAIKRFVAKAKVAAKTNVVKKGE